MVFSSISFIFIFLPVLLTVYFLSRANIRNYILLLASIIFYAWGNPKYLIILLSTILTNYAGSIFLCKYPKYKKIILFLTIFVNLSILFYFKYFNFVITNINHFMHSHFNITEIILPIGISFYIFQAMSYVIDVYRNKCSVQKNIFKLSLYICLFPQLVAGPIIKYHDIESQIDNRPMNFSNFNLGIKRFIIGLAKKVLIADTMGVIADKIFIQDPYTFSHLVAWLGAVAYSFQIFFDFSGYSDMAIGLGLIFGFKFAENFNYPYISKSLSEFWRRWHISLSSWFKEYLYIPLGGSKQGKLKQIRNLGIVFLITGIWHGAKWNFIIWGLWHALFIIIEKIINIEKFPENKLINAGRNIYLCLVVMFGWVFFRSKDLLYAKEYLMNMLGFIKVNSADISFNIVYYVDVIEILVFIAAILCSVPLNKNILEKDKPSTRLVVNTFLLFVFFLSVIKLASETYNTFIYFKF